MRREQAERADSDLPIGLLSCTSQLESKTLVRVSFRKLNSAAFWGIHAIETALDTV